MKKIFFLILLINNLSAHAQQQYVTEKDIPYYPDAINKEDKYVASQCMLDMYYPKGAKNFATIIWFHGGGITGGTKEIPKALTEKGYAVIGVEYRLSPKVKAPAYIEDAAAAVAWAFQHIASYGGDPNLIFVSGHSAGGYLGMMITLDKKYLDKYHIDANHIAALIPFSGQAITHFTIRQEKGIKDTQPVIDAYAPLYHVRADAPPMLGQAITHFTIRQENGIKDTQPVIDAYAPLYHVRADAPPMLLITGDREKEMLGRYEENAYLNRMMKLAGHKRTTLYELQGFDHGGMAEPAFPLLLKEVAAVSKEINGQK